MALLLMGISMTQSAYANPPTWDELHKWGPAYYKWQSDTIGLFIEVKKLLQAAINHSEEFSAHPKKTMRPKVAHAEAAIETIQNWKAFFPEKPTFDNFFIPYDDLLTHFSLLNRFIGALKNFGHYKVFEPFDIPHLEARFENSMAFMMRDPRLLNTLLSLKSHHPLDLKTPVQDKLNPRYEKALAIHFSVLHLVRTILIAPPKGLTDAINLRQSFFVKTKHPLRGHQAELKSPELLKLMVDIQDPKEQEKLWKLWQQEFGEKFVKDPSFLKALQELRHRAQTLNESVGLSKDIPKFKNYADYYTYLAGDGETDPLKLMEAQLKSTDDIMIQAKAEFKKAHPEIPFQSFHFYHLAGQGGGLLDPFFPKSRQEAMVTEVFRMMGIDYTQIIKNGWLAYDYSYNQYKEPNGMMTDLIWSIKKASHPRHDPFIAITGILDPKSVSGDYEEFWTKLHELGHLVSLINKGLIPDKFLVSGQTDPKIDMNLQVFHQGSKYYEEIWSQFFDEAGGKLDLILKLGETLDGEKITREIAEKALKLRERSSILDQRQLLGIALTHYRIYHEDVQSYADINRISTESLQRAWLLDKVGPTEWASNKLHFLYGPDYWTYFGSRGDISKELIKIFEDRFGTMFHQDVGRIIMILTQAGTRLTPQDALMLAKNPDLLDQLEQNYHACRK